MPVYRKCTECLSNVLDGTLCKCEIDKKKKSYKEYKQRLRQDETESKLMDFYNSPEWHRLRASVNIHQFGLDLIEWSKGNIVQADTYHHIEEVRECWDKRLDVNNIIGVTSANHNKLHSLINKSIQDKRAIQKALKQILMDFENEFYV